MVAASAQGNTLQALHFSTATNAQITAGGQTGNGNFTVTLPPGTQQTSFTIRRTTAGQPTTVNLVTVDRCGEWPTVVGGGSSAF